ncbi:uncharacterized protein LOC143024898 isoform X2 [Oratosquilla oratoria]|uniref:uncharacterized protein LOC143024898 isoform X2 n=1 Tax=Oratosquilla oratoria TaxID=337810 RepID=UPI003F75D817
MTSSAAALVFVRALGGARGGTHRSRNYKNQLSNGMGGRYGRHVDGGDSAMGEPIDINDGHLKTGDLGGVRPVTGGIVGDAPLEGIERHVNSATGSFGGGTAVPGGTVDVRPVAGAVGERVPVSEVNKPVSGAINGSISYSIPIAGDVRGFKPPFVGTDDSIHARVGGGIHSDTVGNAGIVRDIQRDTNGVTHGDVYHRIQGVSYGAGHDRRQKYYSKNKYTSKYDYNKYLDNDFILTQILYQSNWNE